MAAFNSLIGKLQGVGSGGLVNGQLNGAVAPVAMKRDWSEGSAFHRQRLLRSGLKRGRPKTSSELASVAPLELVDIVSVRDLVVANPYQMPKGSLRSLERNRKWPLSWSMVDGVPLAYSHDDLKLLTSQGGDLMTGAGVRPADTVAIAPEGIATHHLWQLEAGARKCEASVASVADSEYLNSIAASVLVVSSDRAEALLNAALVGGVNLVSLHTIIAVGDGDISGLGALCGDAVAVVRFWAPDGVFGLWGQCRYGEGLHTWLNTEVVELVDPTTGLALPPTSQRSGRIYWTGTSWNATNMLRLDTKANALGLRDVCSECGRLSMRVAPTPEAVVFEELMDVIAPQASWCAEVARGKARPQLRIYLGAADSEATRQLVEVIESEAGDPSIGLVEPTEVDRRVESNGGERFVDRRAEPAEVAELA